MQEAGGEDKLRELCCAGSAAPAAVKKAARLALASSGAAHPHGPTARGKAKPAIKWPCWGM